MRRSRPMKIPRRFSGWVELRFSLDIFLPAGEGRGEGYAVYNNPIHTRCRNQPIYHEKSLTYPAKLKGRRQIDLPPAIFI